MLEVIRQIAQDHNRIILIVTHEMNFAREVADRILFMEDGVIIADEPSEVFFSQEAASPRISRFLEQMRSRSK